MPGFDIFDTVETLRRSGAPFCVATVLRTADATSAKAGAKAAVTQTGEVLGHMGGACVQRAIRIAAEEALTEGTPRMIRVKPSDTVVAMADPDGARVFGSGCPSGGTVDLLIEPYALPPRLVIFGDTPIAQAIAAHGALAGFQICRPDDTPEAAIHFESLAELTLRPSDFVTVAAQGRGDLAALRDALQSPARRVSMVASRRKAEVLMGKLEAEGMDRAQVRRLKSPAGLDLGGVDPHEIALSVLAEIVRWRNSDARTIPEDDAERA